MTNITENHSANHGYDTGTYPLFFGGMKIWQETEPSQHQEYQHCGVPLHQASRARRWSTGCLRSQCSPPAPAQTWAIPSWVVWWFELGGPAGYSLNPNTWTSPCIQKLNSNACLGLGLCNSFSITGCRILLTKFHLQLAHQFRELGRSAQQGRRKGHKFGVLLVGTPKPEFNKMKYQVLPPDPWSLEVEVGETDKPQLGIIRLSCDTYWGVMLNGSML